MRKNYIFKNQSPADSIAAEAIVDAIAIPNPFAPFIDTEYEDSARSIFNNLYNDDSLNIGIAAELVQLAGIAGYDDSKSFAILYRKIDHNDKSRFHNIVKDIFNIWKRDLSEQQGKDSGEPADQLNYGEGDDKTKPAGKKEDQKPVQQEKREPVKQAPVAAAPQVQQQVDQKAAHAAHQLGFNINNFLKQPQPVAGVPPFVPPVAGPVVQQQPQAAVPQQQADQPIPPRINPMPDADINGKATELKKHYKFIEGAHPEVNESQIDSLLYLLQNSKLKEAVKKNEARCRANNIYMVEIEVPKDKKKQYDFAFRISTKDPKKSILVLFNSKQKFIKQANAWGNDMELSVA